jgi:hypothetical protein
MNKFQLKMLQMQDQVQGWDTYWCLRLNRYSTRLSVARSFKLISRMGDGWVLVWHGTVYLGLVWYGGVAIADSNFSHQFNGTVDL